MLIRVLAAIISFVVLLFKVQETGLLIAAIVFLAEIVVFAANGTRCLTPCFMTYQGAKDLDR